MNSGNALLSSSSFARHNSCKGIMRSTNLPIQRVVSTVIASRLRTTCRYFVIGDFEAFRRSKICSTTWTGSTDASAIWTKTVPVMLKLFKRNTLSFPENTRSAYALPAFRCITQRTWFFLQFRQFPIQRIADRHVCVFRGFGLLLTRPVLVQDIVQQPLHFPPACVFPAALARNQHSDHATIWRPQPMLGSLAGPAAASLDATLHTAS